MNKPLCLSSCTEDASDRRRTEIAANIARGKQNYQSGNVFRGTVDASDRTAKQLKTITFAPPFKPAYKALIRKHPELQPCI
ncbi:hypothetical protein QUB63_24430 [Microcoleus sp. ARI1-B5]|uniref:hypothetical protein n=1 Tax=unclassified Microcoleus TaxID=2642155 RepID=UPI002FD3F321